MIRSLQLFLQTSRRSSQTLSSVIQKISLSSHSETDQSAGSDGKGDVKDRINKYIAVTSAKDFTTRIKYDPDKPQTQADWISWLSKKVNYDTYIEDAIESQNMRNLRSMQE